jgi:hypothetical protein
LSRIEVIKIASNCRALSPVYFIARDRATLIAGLYDVYYRDVSKEEVWQHVTKYGFNNDWTLRGLKTYFE